ncbi:MAG: hypothetical protein V4722_24255 [Bacteroidota bacterium]
MKLPVRFNLSYLKFSAFLLPVLQPAKLTVKAVHFKEKYSEANYYPC